MPELRQGCLQDCFHFLPSAPRGRGLTARCVDRVWGLLARPFARPTPPLSARLALPGLLQEPRGRPTSAQPDGRWAGAASLGFRSSARRSTPEKTQKEIVLGQGCTVRDSFSRTQSDGCLGFFFFLIGSPTRTLGFKTSQKLQTRQCLCAQMLFPNHVPLESAPGADVMSAYSVADGCARSGSKVAPLCVGCKPAGHSLSPREKQRWGESRHSRKPPELTPARTSSCSRTPCLPHSAPRDLPFPMSRLSVCPAGAAQTPGPGATPQLQALGSRGKGEAFVAPSRDAILGKCDEFRGWGLWAPGRSLRKIFPRRLMPARWPRTL